MTNETMPADWAIKRASDLTSIDGGAWDVETMKTWGVGKAFARYIEAHEKPPVDRKLLCAREAAFHTYYDAGAFGIADAVNDGCDDKDSAVVASIAAITLWEEGFGNDQH